MKKIFYGFILLFFSNNAFAVQNKCPNDQILTYDTTNQRYDCTCFNNRDYGSFNIANINSGSRIPYKFFSCKDMDYTDNYNLPYQIQNGPVLWIDASDLNGIGYDIYKINNIALNTYFLGPIISASIPYPSSQNSITQPLIQSFISKTNFVKTIYSYFQTSGYHDTSKNSSYTNSNFPDFPHKVIQNYYPVSYVDGYGTHNNNSSGAAFNTIASSITFPNGAMTIFAVYIDDLENTPADSQNRRLKIMSISSLISGNEDDNIHIYRNKKNTLYNNAEISYTDSVGTESAMTATNLYTGIGDGKTLGNGISADRFHLAVINFTDNGLYTAAQIFTDPAPQFDSTATRFSGLHPRYSMKKSSGSGNTLDVPGQNGPAGTFGQNNTSGGFDGNNYVFFKDLASWGILSMQHKIGTLPNFYRIAIGNQANANMQSLKIAEIIVYIGELEYGQRAIISDHLRDKWGIYKIDPKWW